jgi:hypothetical protein
MERGSPKYHVRLTDGERALLERIDFSLLESSISGKQPADPHAVYLTNQAPILALLKSLGERGAIPSARIKYWTEPSYNNGRIKTSRKGLFERNGCYDEEIYTHPNFLSYLRYFLFGADLPESVIRSFEERVGNPEWVTSSDVVPISRHARQLMREHRLPYEAPEEFFKLALDMGLSIYTASAIEGSAKQVRRRN